MPEISAGLTREQSRVHGGERWRLNIAALVPGFQNATVVA